ncbi:YcaO-like family protein [Burkholderia sp. ABCPW 14]|uniref:YcaO-like family protein n=1 Tax=Burkholderia sp. ABCPW 14 TaxID=1637860 RepID=UPI0009EC7389|nr:YcaO-like family protein [Burkholderia sp. ABCPW 14]
MQEHPISLETFSSSNNSFMSPSSQVLARTLALAEAYLERCGITRVTDITRMDVIGVPVYSAIRPLSLTLAVNAGKGMTREAAKISAIMEAIEYWHAEQIPAEAAHFASSAAMHAEHGISILDFCPELGATLERTQPIGWVPLENLSGGAAVFVPMECVFMPCPPPYGANFLRATSCGMACGTTIEQATLHAVCEVVERHQQSFDIVAPRSRATPLRLPTGDAAELAEKIDAAGLTLKMRARYDMGLFYVDAVVAATESASLSYVNGGTSCHSDFQLAARAALLEAIQSRLTVIHGGRDDLDERLAPSTSKTYDVSKSEIERILNAYSSGIEVTAQEIRMHSREHAVARLIDEIRSAGFARVLRHRFTQPDDPLQVVRVVIPQMEHFSRATGKLGLRLLDYIRSTGGRP